MLAYTPPRRGVLDPAKPDQFTGVRRSHKSLAALGKCEGFGSLGESGTQARQLTPGLSVNRPLQEASTGTFSLYSVC
jgi:hypothetical protein